MMSQTFRYADGVVPNVMALGFTLAGYGLGVVLLTQDFWVWNLLGFALVVLTLVWSAYFIHEFAHQAIFRDPALNERWGTLMSWLKGSCYARFADLRRMGIKTVMITGDNPLTAAAIAAEAGVDDFLAQATPEDKLKLIRDEQAKGKGIRRVRWAYMTATMGRAAPSGNRTDVPVFRPMGYAPAQQPAADGAAWCRRCGGQPPMTSKLRPMARRTYHWRSVACSAHGTPWRPALTQEWRRRSDSFSSTSA